MMSLALVLTVSRRSLISVFRVLISPCIDAFAPCKSVMADDCWAVFVCNAATSDLMEISACFKPLTSPFRVLISPCIEASAP